MAETRYSVTYAFNGYLLGDRESVVSLITETVSQMQEQGIDIEFLGATQVVDASGELRTATVRYSAPRKRTIARLNCRACLPPSGSSQRHARDDTESTGWQATALGG
jgi:hypothetical protein